MSIIVMHFLKMRVGRLSLTIWYGMYTCIVIIQGLLLYMLYPFSSAYIGVHMHTSCIPLLINRQMHIYPPFVQILYAKSPYLFLDLQLVFNSKYTHKHLLHKYYIPRHICRKAEKAFYLFQCRLVLGISFC